MNIRRLAWVLCFASAACSTPVITDAGADVPCAPACAPGAVCIGGRCYRLDDASIDDLGGGDVFDAQDAATLPDSIDSIDVTDDLGTDVADGDAVDDSAIAETAVDAPPPCGDVDESCCIGGVCASSDLTCVSGVCRACGHRTQPCCAGMCEAGELCNAGTCELAPYSGCTTSEIGSACLEGPAYLGGAPVSTQCQRLLGASSGDGFCTSECAAAGTECPAWIGATRTYTLNCYILSGNTRGQCFVDCAAFEMCPTNTVCRTAANSLGQIVRLCLPPVPPDA